MGPENASLVICKKKREWINKRQRSSQRSKT